MRIVSQGELKKGMYVTVLQVMLNERVCCPFTGTVTRNKGVDDNPWIKGIPLRIIEINGPIVAIDSRGLQNLPPVMFLDSRYATFLESSKRFHDRYYLLMKD